MKTIKVWITAVLLFAFVLSGCAGPGSANPSGGGQPEAEGVRTLRIGVGNTFRPYAYIDRDGLPTGFEPALLREIDRRIPEVQFVYEPLDMTGLILGLEGGRLDMIVYQLGKNAEREQKFWFGGESYLKTGVQVTVAADSGITGLADLRGKTLSMNPSESSNVVVDAFNAENPDQPIRVVYRDGTADPVLLVATGKVEACLAQPAQVLVKQKENGMQVKTVGELLDAQAVYPIWRKDESLREPLEAFDEAVRQMRADGTLAKLSTEWLGEDLTR